MLTIFKIFESITNSKLILILYLTDVDFLQFVKQLKIIKDLRIRIITNIFFILK